MKNNCLSQNCLNVSKNLSTAISTRLGLSIQDRLRQLFKHEKLISILEQREESFYRGRSFHLNWAFNQNNKVLLQGYFMLTTYSTVSLKVSLRLSTHKEAREVKKYYEP